METGEGDQCVAAVEIGDALRDPDPLVRWTAVRTIRSIPAKKVTANAIKGLGALVTDPDPNISADAARTIEALGVHAADAVDSLARFALRGAVPRDDRLRDLGFRFLVVTPHLVFYKVLAREARVYRVLHGQRAYEEIL